jgi:hypothetical protein
MNRLILVVAACTAIAFTTPKAVGAQSHPGDLVGAWWATAAYGGDYLPIFQLFPDGRLRIDYEYSAPCSRYDAKFGATVAGTCYRYEATQQGSWRVSSAGHLCLEMLPGASKWKSVCTAYKKRTYGDSPAIKTDSPGTLARLDSLPSAEPFKPSFTAGHR